MRREFKFRAWWIDQQKFDYIDSFKKFSSYSFPLDWCVIQQYTGLKDSQGREIYEGDILECPYHYNPILKLLVMWYSKMGNFPYRKVNKKTYVYEKYMGSGSVMISIRHQRVGYFGIRHLLLGTSSKIQNF